FCSIPYFAPYPCLYSFPTRRSSDLFFVGCAVAPDFLLHAFEVVAAQIEQPRKIIWIAYVHGIRIGRLRRARMEFSGAQIFRHDIDRKSTRLNSSHEWISYAVFCLKK